MPKTRISAHYRKTRRKRVYVRRHTRKTKGKKNYGNWKPHCVPHDTPDLKEAEQHILKKYQKTMGERPYNPNKAERLWTELLDVRGRIKSTKKNYGMMGALYPTKKALKESIGQELKHEETSMFGPEYKPDGEFTVVGPSPTKRVWYATVTMKDGRIKKVK